MKEERRYQKLESVTYTFTDEDVYSALVEKFKIKLPTIAEGDWEWNRPDSYYDDRKDGVAESPASITVRFKTTLEKGS